MIHDKFMKAMSMFDKAVASGLTKEEYCEKEGISLEEFDKAIETINCHKTEQKKITEMYSAYTSMKNTTIADIHITYEGIEIKFPKGTSKDLFNELYNSLQLIEMNKV